MASPSPSGNANAQTLSASSDTENASVPASENKTVVKGTSRSLVTSWWRRLFHWLKIDHEDTSSTARGWLALPAELRQQVLGEVVGFCNIDATAAEAILRLPKDPVAKLKELKELERTGVISDKDKSVYSRLRPFFSTCSTIREDMEYIEREWLRKRAMNLAELESWLDNPTNIDSIALSINSESFLRSPPAGYEGLVEQHKLELFDRPVVSPRQVEQAYYKRWSAAIRRLPLRRFGHIELHDLEGVRWTTVKKDVREAYFQSSVADLFRTYLIFRTRSCKISSVVVVRDPGRNRAPR